MTSIWNENLSLFAERFPDLAQMLQPQIPAELLQGQNAAALTARHIQDLNAAFPFYDFSLAKNGQPTASQNALALHSNYNPGQEAARAAQAALSHDKDIFIFASIGLGYLPLELSKIPAALDKTFIVLEPDAPHFFAALASVDLTALFRLQKLFFAIGADVDQAATLVQCAGGFDKSKIFWQKSQTAHAQEWFDKFFAVAQQRRDAAQANVNTLERFGRLWLKNGARNLRQLQKLRGASAFFGAARLDQPVIAARDAAILNSLQAKEAAPNFSYEFIPSVLLAAGPSLQDLLPLLPQIQERAVTIAVDTALRACLAAGVEPDFIVLTDPQYWASRHIAGLSAPHSILVAESASYPSVFRFNCKEIVLMSSLFPLGKYFEARLGQNGPLASGGSVATSAWDFAKAIGSKEIFVAGLDLGYPNNQTHIKGSAFEEAAHASSSRLNPAELQTARILFSAKNSLAKDFEGNPIITDQRMRLFAGWFESQIARTQEAKTWSFSKRGLAIKGIEFYPPTEFLSRPKIKEQKEAFFARAQSSAAACGKENFDTVMAQLKSGLQKISALAQKGLALCNDILCGDTRAQKRVGELDAIDKEILQSDAKNVAALVFPTQRQLQKIFERAQFPQDPLKNAAAKSKIVYAELLKSIEEFLKIC